MSWFGLDDLSLACIVDDDCLQRYTHLDGGNCWLDFLRQTTTRVCSDDCINAFHWWWQWWLYYSYLSSLPTLSNDDDDDGYADDADANDDAAADDDDC